MLTAHIFGSPWNVKVGDVLDDGQWRALAEDLLQWLAQRLLEALVVGAQFHHAVFLPVCDFAGADQLGALLVPLVDGADVVAVLWTLEVFVFLFASVIVRLSNLAAKKQKQFCCCFVYRIVLFIAFFWLFIYLFISYLFICLFISYLFICLFIYLFRIYLFVYLFIYFVFIYLFICSFIYLFVYLFIYFVFIYLFIYLFISYLFICLFICLLVWLLLLMFTIIIFCKNLSYGFILTMSFWNETNKI